ncbi:hypothetical protein ACLB1S_13670 [Escherichia coli]
MLFLFITALSPLFRTFLHAVRDELVRSQENGTVQIKGETVYKATTLLTSRSPKSAWKPAAFIVCPVV